MRSRISIRGYVRPSVGPSVGRSVPLYFFCVFELFEGRIARVLVFCGCLCPCPSQFCPCPTHYCPCLTHYCPCPTARDRGSRVYGLVLFAGDGSHSRAQTIETPKAVPTLPRKMSLHLLNADPVNVQVLELEAASCQSSVPSSLLSLGPL